MPNYTIKLNLLFIKKIKGNKMNEIQQMAAIPLGPAFEGYFEILDPVKIGLLDIESYIKKHGCKPVTSHSIKMASSTDFHPEGLFSEDIFGQIGTTDRLVRFGYIDLHTKVFHPLVYRAIIDLKQLYGQILEGKTYAVFDEKEGDFVRCKKTDPKADTGYSFFMKNWNNLVLKRNKSVKRNEKIDLIEKYQDRLFTNKFLVEPAGIRDIEAEDAMLQEEDINKLYSTLLGYSQAMPKGNTNRAYDGIRINIQKKLYEIFAYIKDILQGKKGYLRGTYARRKIVWGTRNVISAAKLDAMSPDDPRALNPDEVLMPLYQTMAAYKPLTAYYLKTLAFNNIFTPNNTQVSAIDKTTGKTVYIQISSSDLEKYTTTEGVYELIDRFQDNEFRDSEMTISDIDGKEYYLYMIHDYNDDLVLFRNKDDMYNIYKGTIDEASMRPITWGEMMYIATYKATVGKHIFTTRYPIGQGPDSVYPAKVRLASTVPNRLCRVLNPTDPENSYLVMEHYPIIGERFKESMSVHSSRLESLKADHDGDTASSNSVMDNSSNEEVSNYIGTLRELITPNGELYCGANTDNSKLTIFNLTRIPEGVSLD